MRRIALLLMGLCWPFALWAEAIPETVRAAQVVFLGEIHDNPVHHEVQAAWVSALAPRAVVFEMLTEGAAERVRGVASDTAEVVAQAAGWAESGWPDFALYYPIFRAAARYGLDRALDAEAQIAAQDEQRAAHCDALPEDMLPSMVEVQRLRDAVLAQVAAQALAETGGPVAVILGNGHARLDGGAPEFLARAEPQVRHFSLGQSEDGAVFGQFDWVVDAPAVLREDPCKAFR
ncbi:MAG TPA: hypothetical protein DEF12_00550 [Rhodobacteraceae bacterium]|jgi:uncharacterized iron-regulated protein|nr:hypothetical protein [Paracoccaceae bacterium]